MRARKPTLSKINIFITLMIFFCVGSFGDFARAGQNVKSKVSAVTVYADRALITRASDVTLSPGVNTVEFDGLPIALADQSLRVSGEAESDVKILDVQIKTVFIDTISNEHVQELYNRLSSLKNEEQILTKKKDVFAAEMALVDSLRIYYARSAQGGVTKNSYEDWTKMIEFLEKTMNSINEKALDNESKLQDVRNRITSVQAEIQQTQSYPKKSEKHIVVTLSSDKSGSTTLSLSYVIGGASWTPLYEVRASSGNKTMELTYSGMVRQTTGEDWKAVAVALSTAQPRAAGAPPVLPPWQVSEYQPVSPAPVVGFQPVNQERQSLPSLSLEIVHEAGPGNTIKGRVVDRENGQALPGTNVLVMGTSYGAATDLDGNYAISSVPDGSYRLRLAYVGYQPTTSSMFEVNSSSAVRADFLLGESSVQGEAVMVRAKAQGQMQAVNQQLSSNNVANIVSFSTAEVQERSTSSTFVIPASADIPSDNNPHKVTITIASLPVQFSYSCVPKFSPEVYLTAKAKDSTDYPLISGTTNVFLDNSFVASSSISTVFPGEEFETYLGTDEAIKAERKLEKQFTESTGLLSRKTKTTYDFLITVENDKKVSLDIDVKDQIPVSKDEKIVVELLAPDPIEAKPDEQGIINWHLSLKPQEKKELRLKFSIEHPIDMMVRGF